MLQRGVITSMNTNVIMITVIIAITITNVIMITITHRSEILIIINYAMFWRAVSSSSFSL